MLAGCAADKLNVIFLLKISWLFKKTKSFLSGDCMHLPSHTLSGWCVGRHFNISAKERLFAMLAASFPDLDALSAIFFGEIQLEGWKVIAGGPHYQTTHHILGHNLFAAILFSLILIFFSRRELSIFLIYFGAYHLHLLCDLLGSGAGWGVRYFWPMSDHSFEVTWGWDLNSWPNMLALFVLLAWMLWLIRRYQTTPLECIVPKMDKKLVEWVNKFVEK